MGYNCLEAAAVADMITHALHAGLIYTQQHLLPN
jgi:hypothetical protein